MSSNESRVSFVYPYSEDGFTQETNSAACIEKIYHITFLHAAKERGSDLVVCCFYHYSEARGHFTESILQQTLVCEIIFLKSIEKRGRSVLNL